jgi:hypothetical protein
MKRRLTFRAFLFLSFSCFQAWAQNYEQGFQTRASQITNRLADSAAIRSFGGSIYFGQEFTGSGSTPDPEKHVWPVAIARLKKYGNADTAANRLISKYKNRDPFHFTYIGMARIMSQFPLADSMLVLKNKYLQQVWNRTDSYNPWTGEGTENHINMNKTSGYLYAQHSLPGSAFPQAGPRLAETKDWIRWYGKRLYEKGNSEWNSSTYESYNLVGWLNLYDFAQDPEVKNIARAILDYYACELALHCSYGLTGGSESRGSVVNWGSGADYISWLWFGFQSRLMGTGFWTGKEYSQTMHAAVSSYRPPMLAVMLAKKEIPMPAWFRNSKPDYNQNIAEVVKQTFYTDKSFTLGAAMVPTLGWSGGNTQYCNWKLVSQINQPAPGVNAQVVTGGSRLFNEKDGRGKGPWDQYLQYKNVMVGMNKMPLNARQLYSGDSLTFFNATTGWKTKWANDFDLRFPNDVARTNPVGMRTPNFANNISYISFPQNNPGGGSVNTLFRNQVFFVQLERTYLAIRSISNTQVSNPANESTGRNFVADNSPAGSLCGWITEARSSVDFASFTAFQDSVLAKTNLDKSQLATDKVLYTNMKGEVLEIQYSATGSAPQEPLYDWGFGPVTQQLYQTTPPYLQPSFPSGPGFGRIPVLKVNGNDQGYGQSGWAVYEGPGLQVKNSELMLSKDSAGLTVYCKVNFSGNNPVFDCGILTSVERRLPGKPNTLKIFPNPSLHEVVVIAPELEAGTKVDIEILNQAGQKVWNQSGLEYGKDGLQIKGLPLSQGTFILWLRSVQQVFQGKVVFQ